MDKAETYPIHVLARDVDNNPIQISVNGKIFESPDSGLFFVPLKDVEGVTLAVLGDLDITLMVAERVDENEIEYIPYSILHVEVKYYRDGAYAWIFEFKPRKYLDVRADGRKVSPMDVLEAYFYALGMAEKLDPRVEPVDKDSWHFDGEDAEAELKISLPGDMAIKQAVDEVKEIFRKIDQEAINILGDILEEKKKKRKSTV